MTKSPMKLNFTSANDVTLFKLHAACPQKRACKRIIRAIGIRQFKRQQRRFIAHEMAGAA